MSSVDICPQCQYLLPFEKDRVFHSPLADLLETNDTLTDARRRLAEEVVADLSLSIKVLEEQMSRFRKSVDRLKLYRHQHQLLLSKVRDFPTEVLEMIFQACVDSCAKRKVVFTSDDLEYKRGDVRNVPHSTSRMAIPLTIAMVCRRWRAIALSIPSLWNNIHFSLGFWKPERWEKITPRFIQWAGNHKLSIDLGLNDWRNAEKGPLILDTLCSRSEQWKEAQVMLSVSTLAHFTSVMAKLDDRLPELEFLGIGTTARNPSPSIRLTVAPKLRTLQLVNIRCDHLMFPWSQLRELTLFQIDWRCALNLMMICPNLESLRYEVFEASNRTQPDATHCRHRRLSSLELIATPTKCLFLDTLDIPSLSNLTLTVQPGEDASEAHESYPAHALERFLSRAQGTLQTLSLNNMNIPVVKCADLFALVPDLMSLRLTESIHVFYNDLLELLAVAKEGSDAGDEPILPRLRHLEYTFYARSSRHSEYSMAFELVGNVIKARRTSADKTSILQPLRSVKVRGPRPEADAECIPAYNKLLTYRQKGLSVETYFFSPPEHLIVRPVVFRISGTWRLILFNR